MLFWCVRNIEFRRALSTEQSQSDLIVELLYWLLNRMSCLPELYCNAEILYRNWLCLTEWVLGHSGIHGNEEADTLARTGSSSAFVGSELCLPLAPSTVKRR
jgi:ribonuclease HI